jgi:peptidoglycan/xylan/chitin deacetylase (PgdA/CDA1 family)
MIRSMERQKIKATARHIMASICYASNYSLSRLQGKAAILVYHRVLTEKELRQDFIQPGMYVRNDVFEMQMLFLKKHFEILSLHDLLALWKGKKLDKGKRYCVVTFDDGWRDNYLYAFPILQKHGIPATIFLPTTLIGTNQRFWPDMLSKLLLHCYSADVPEEKRKAIASLWQRFPCTDNINNKNVEDRIDLAIEQCKELSDEKRNEIIREMIAILGLSTGGERVLLTWDEVREMSNKGISFGSHSCTHKILTKCPAKVVQEEIQDSSIRLQEKGINYMPVFCYPNGDYNQEIARQVKAAGYLAAVSTHFGLEDGSAHHHYELKRIGIHNDISSTVPLFAYRLSGIRL